MTSSAMGMIDANAVELQQRENEREGYTNSIISNIHEEISGAEGFACLAHGHVH